MIKLKNILLMGTAYVTVAAMSIGGTMAYLTSEDSDVNVMTMGNVEIEQIELQRKDQTANNDIYNLEKFKDNKPLLPSVYETMGWDEDWQEWSTGGSSALFSDDMKNVVDKFVFVRNDGKSDAYVRTWFAFEQGSLTAEEFDAVVGLNINDTHWNWEFVKSDVEIDGNTYYIMVATYLGNAGEDKDIHENGIISPKETTRPSLLQVMLYKTATNEDVEAIDGNKNGKYDILVVSQAVQTQGFANANTALDEAFGTREVKNHPFADVNNVTWDGAADTSWYNDTDTEFVITTAEQLAGFADLVDGGNTFEGKTVKLGNDIDLYTEDGTCFNPIGSYRKDKPFKGTFDGQNHTIENLSQNTWALKTGYYYDDLGLGLFGLVENAIIKNLNMDEASISGESAICGTIAACAYGDTIFENITVTNTNVADYQYYAGGIVGWASGNHQYINCDVDATTTIGGQWGDFGNANGGVIGGMGGSAEIYMKDCDIACRIDGVNDVVSAYQWYNYRNCGMLIGRVPQTITNGEAQTVATPNVICENVTVTYGDWANYTYCEFAGTGYPYVRVQAGTSVDAYSNVRYGHPTDANGNTVVDDNHVHNDGEDHQLLIEFDQLFGGPGNDRYAYYGISEHPGVTVIYNNK